MAGTWGLERIGLKLDDQLGADWRLGRTAVALDLPEREVVLDGDERLPFDGLVIATGATPRRLPGTELDGVFLLRTLDDANAIKGAFASNPRVIVLGAGFIGCEVAATARGLGLDVTMVDIFEEPLQRVLGTEMGAVCAGLHRDHGVNLRMGVASEKIEGEGKVEGITLADGTFLPADVVIVGIGVVPATGWLEGSGLELRDGVVCDETLCALGATDVVAVGDLARWHHPLFGEEMRLEHWTNAAEQADHAATTLVQGPDKAQPFAPIPYFWSDQYDAKIQLVGMPGPEVQVVEGSVEERKFVAAYGREGRLVGALGFSQPRRLMQYRSLISDRASYPPPAD
jgi:NADPH-dependent 2,4-dienoyl-CoA reductase/sulfur reductase-like enzyme